MYRNDNPLHYRRNAISIAPETVKNGPGPQARARSSDDLPPGDKSRLMSVTDETDPRLKKILSRFSLNTDEEGNSSGMSSRLTYAQINGTKDYLDTLSVILRNSWGPYLLEARGPCGRRFPH